MRTREERLGQILLDYGIVDAREIEEALEYQRTWDVRLGRALIDLDLCDEDMILDTLSLQLGVEWVRLTGIDIPADILERVPVQTAVELRAIPVGFRKNKLKVAMSDPASLYHMEILRSAAGVDIVPVLAGDRDIATAIARQYHKVGPQRERSTSRPSIPSRPVAETSDFEPRETTEPVVHRPTPTPHPIRARFLTA